MPQTNSTTDTTVQSSWRPTRTSCPGLVSSKNTHSLMNLDTHTDGQREASLVPRDHTTVVSVPARFTAVTSLRPTTRHVCTLESTSPVSTPRSFHPSGNSKLDLVRESRWVTSFGSLVTSSTELLRTLVSRFLSIPSQFRKFSFYFDATLIS